MLNTPNVLTILRIVMVPSYMFMMYSKTPYANQIAFAFFAIAAFTDFFDGHLARKYKLVTNLGKVLDPVADKIMVTAAMVVLVEQHRLAAWIVILMLLRDFAVGALRDVAAQQGMIIAAGIWGKLKTVLQMLALGFLIFKDPLTIWPPSMFGASTINITGTFSLPNESIGHTLIYIALIASIYSGVIYFLQFRKVFTEMKAKEEETDSL